MGKTSNMMQSIEGKTAQLNSVVFAMFSQGIKKVLAITRKCLIFRVGHLGLEPRTSRL